MDVERHPGAGDASIATALERLLLASQRVLFARLDLLLLEVHDATSRTLRAMLLGGVAIGIAIGGWFALLAGVVLGLGEAIGNGPSLLVIGVLNFGGAIGGLMLLVRDSRRPPPVSAQALPDVDAVSAAPQRVPS
ncbi:MAG: phage holin family protein [Candidatus Binatia bacterium]